MKNLRRLLPFLLVFTLSSAASFAQKCFDRGLENGRKHYAAGNQEAARQAWEEAMTCTKLKQENQVLIDSLLNTVTDEDDDGIVNANDKCPSQFGAASKNGCPCYKPLRREGLDLYYDGELDQATGKLEAAKACEDRPANHDLDAWAEKITQRKNSPPPPPASIPAENQEELMRLVEEKPEYPGGEMAMMQHLFSNIRYPSVARENGIQGTVVVTFVVEKDGNLSHFKIARDVAGGCSEEAMRVVESMPAWIPGKQNGVPVRVQYTLPIKFKLE